MHIRRIAEGGENPGFEATLAPDCTATFEYDGGMLGGRDETSTCSCGPGLPPGHVTVTGAFHDGQLELTATVSYAGPEYSGGCSYTLYDHPT